MNEYGDDDFAAPEIEDEDVLTEADVTLDDLTFTGPVDEADEHLLDEPRLDVDWDMPEPATVPEGAYYLVDNGVVVEILDANERWGRHLLDGQNVVRASDFDG